MTKHFDISKEVVYEAYRKVKANKGAAGVDGESIADFERDLDENLYKIWNRMSSGTYFPPAVRSVEIPKNDGKSVRRLSVPTVADRIAQMVVKLYLEPSVEPIFHPDSYGYRPAKSALEAVAKARERCWEYDWVIDLDISQFFDSLDHLLVMEMVKKHTNCRWILLYIERWLKAPVKMVDGSQQQRDRGSPQGSVISPLISNIFLHHVFDDWMRKQFPSIPFERYADDALAHCRTQKQAEYVKDSIAKRFRPFRLELHPEKTRIVYCKREGRDAIYPNVQFTFLGYSFRMRSARNHRGEMFNTFSPAVSDKAAKAIRRTIRSWRLHRHSDKSLAEIAEYINPTVRGWLNYYGRFNKSIVVRALYTVNRYLLRWAVRKYKRFRLNPVAAWSWLGRVARHHTQLFAHWQSGLMPGAE
jgi:RNA-directed DNA polymerase